jgi:hypothetical protein
LENPLSKDVEFDVTLSNNRDYRVLCESDNMNWTALPFDLLRTASKINIKARNSEVVSVIFWPSSLTQENDQTRIEFSDHAMGSIVYSVRGKGRLPELMDEIIICATINSNVSNSLVFVNPLVDPISVTVKLISEVDQSSAVDTAPKQLKQTRRLSTKPFSALTLITNKTKYQIAAQGRLEIPFMYHPTSMISQTNSKLVIEMSNQLKWVFPIKVLTTC